MNKIGWVAAAAWGICTAAFGQTPVSHWDLQSVTSTGTSAWVETFPFTIQGVILNDPEEMLDPAYNPDATGASNGGQFQMFIQAVTPGDRGGTAVYMAQMSFLAGNNYDEAGWNSEMQRVMFDGNGRKFRKGDLVEVTARKALFYNGKRNINEAHRIDPANNFDITLVRPNTVLPPAEVLTLADLKNADDSAIFDATRADGGEHYQGMRVRIDGLRLVDTNGWGQTAWANRICTAADDTGRTFTLRMPRTDLGAPPATSEYVSAVGIMNQEGGVTNGYELFVQEIRPALSLGPTAVAGGAAVSFPADYDGYVLESTDDVGGGVWTPVDATPVRMIVIEDNDEAEIRFYRLRKAD